MNGYIIIVSMRINKKVKLFLWQTISIKQIVFCSIAIMDISMTGRQTANDFVPSVLESNMGKNIINYNIIIYFVNTLVNRRI